MQQQRNDFELYCHVGLGKTASTYLQYRLFPKLKGIRYIQRTRYRRFPRIIESTNDSKYLVSREFDRQFEEEVRKIAATYPDARIIIVLRRNDSWIASQYRRYVKNGGVQPFEKFLDLEHDQGLWKKKDVYFYPKIQLVEELFHHKPLILWHGELKKDPWTFFDRIARYTGTTYNRNQIVVNPSHKSYSEKQLKILQRFMSSLFPCGWKGSKNRVKHYIRFRSRWLLLHLVLYVAAVLPKSLAGEDPLIPPEQLERVKKFFEEDWEKCEERIDG